MDKKSFTYAWCWECNAPTIDLNNGRANICCARFDYDHKEYLEALEWMKSNPPPEAPSPEELDDILNWGRFSEEERAIIEIFDGFSLGRYWLPKKWADKIGHEVPSYEDLCEKIGIKPVYNLKTGKQWSEDEEKHVFDREGWPEEGSFESEEIPWSEFCKRQWISKMKHKRRMKENEKQD